MARTGSFFLSALLVAGFLPGCGWPGKATVFPVEGQLLVAGRPAANAMIAFRPVRGTAVAVLAVAVTGADGRFRLTTYQAGDGAPAGEYAVTVVWPDASLPLDECADPVTHDRLAGRYADPLRTNLRATVHPQANCISLTPSLPAGNNWSLPRLRDLEPK